MQPLPKITVRDGVVCAGPFILEPSDKRWKRRLCHWRCRRDGVVLTGWFPTPLLALRAALKTA